MPPGRPKPDADSLRRCAETLQDLVSDRTLLSALPEAERVALLAAAGRLSRPDKLDQRAEARRRRLERRKARQEADRAVRAGTQIREARREAVYAAPERLAGPEDPAAAGPELAEPRNCYVCKGEFRRVHFFYDSMCPGCAALNYSKRFQTCDLSGRVAVVTGARLKIGYQASLMLLRAGATVVATTRFPNDAARRYAGEKDFPVWGERLRVHGLDLRHSPSVEIFCRYLETTLPRLDFLINNAAQTVRRPPAFYAHLLDREALPPAELPPDQRALLESHAALCGMLGAPAAPALPAPGADATGMAVWHRGAAGIGLRGSAALSQVKYAYGEEEVGLDVFPQGRTDADEQQVDLRRMNSWRMALADVPTAEMIELQLINAVAPFILCAKLKRLMLRSPERDKHMVNVSAMEGVFSRGTKTDKHPHTNMAKAALNMLTLTSARDYVKDGIHMNAVDTGWVTDEDPAHLSERKRQVHDFQPPLDIVDGAARVCDPVFSGFLTGRHVWGKFLKDYAPAAW